MPPVPKIAPWVDLPTRPGVYIVEYDDDSELCAIFVGYGAHDELVAWKFGDADVVPVEKVPFVRHWALVSKGTAT